MTDVVVLLRRWIEIATPLHNAGVDDRIVSALLAQQIRSDLEALEDDAANAIIVTCERVCLQAIDQAP